MGQPSHINVLGVWLVLLLGQARKKPVAGFMAKLVQAEKHCGVLASLLLTSSAVQSCAPSGDIRGGRAWGATNKLTAMFLRSFTPAWPGAVQPRMRRLTAVSPRVHGLIAFPQTLTAEPLIKCVFLAGGCLPPAPPAGPCSVKAQTQAGQTGAMRNRVAFAWAGQCRRRGGSHPAKRRRPVAARVLGASSGREWL